MEELISNSQNYGNIYYFGLIPLKWVVVTFYYPFMPLYFGGMLYLTTLIQIEQYLAWISVVISLATLLIFIIVRGIVELSGSIRLGKIHPSVVAYAQVELGSFFCGFISFFLLTRSKEFYQCIRDKSHQEIIQGGYKAFFFSIFDIAVAPFCLITLITYYRFHPALEESRNSSYPWLVWCLHGLQIVFLDLPAFAVCFPLVMLSVYRILTFWPAMTNEEYENRWTFCWYTSASIIIDLPFFVLAAVPLLSIYRTKRTYTILKEAKNHDANVTRWKLFEQCVCTLFDPIVYPIRLVIFLIPPVSKEYSDKYTQDVSTEPFDDSIQGRIFTCFYTLYLLLELLIFVIFVPVTTLLSPWNLLPLSRDVIHDSKTEPKGVNRMSIYWRHFVKMLADYTYIMPILFFTILSTFRSVLVIRYAIIHRNDEALLKNLLGEAMSQCGYFMLDIPAGLFIVILLLTMYRVPTTISNLKNKNETDSYHFKIFSQMLQFVIDIPFILLGLLSLWRIPLVITKLQWSGESCAERNRVVATYQFLKSLYDIPAILGFCFLCLFIYRVPNLIQKIRNRNRNVSEEEDEEDEFHIHHAVFLEVGQMIVDLPFVLLFLCSMWRIIVILSKLQWSGDLCAQWNRKLITNQFLLFLTDIPAIPCFLIVLLTVYRIPSLISKMRKKPVVETYHPTLFREIGYLFVDVPFLLLGILSIWRIPVIIAKLQWYQDTSFEHNRNLTKDQFLLFLLDIPAIPCFVIILLTLYRIPSLFTASEDETYHWTMYFEALEVLADIPYILLGLLSLWRLVIIIPSIEWYKETSAESNRALATGQFIKVLLDIPAMACFLFLCLSIYRIPGLIAKIYRGQDETTEFFIHIAIFQETGKFMSDLPFIFLGILSLWRIFVIIPKLQWSGDLCSENNRKLATSQFRMTLYDIPAILCTPFLLLFFYRIPSLVQKMRRNEGIQELHYHYVIFREFVEILVDIPFIFFGICSLWRMLVILSRLQWSGDSCAENNRHLAWMQFLKLFCDIPAIVCLLFLCLFVYRVPSVIRNIMEERKREGVGEFYIHIAIFRESREMLIDLPYLLLGVGSLWRIIVIFSKLQWYGPQSSTHNRDLAKDQFIMVLYDIPGIFCSLLIALTIYRIPSLISKMKRRPLYETFHFTIYREAGQLFIDFPYILLGLGSMWRIVAVVPSLKWYEFGSAESNRRVAKTQFLKTLYDIPAIPCFLFLSLFVYRLPNLFRTIKRERKNNIHISDEFHIHHAIYRESLELLIDLPYLLAGALTLWRIPYLIYLVMQDTPLEYVIPEELGENWRRTEALRQLLETLIDIPFSLSFLILLISELHILTIIKYWGTKDFRSKIMWTVLQIPFHIPLILLTYFLTITVYRLPHTLRLIVKYKPTNPQLAKILLYQSLAIFLDILCLFSGLITLVTIIRIKELWDVHKKYTFFETGEFQNIDKILSFKSVTKKHWLVFKVGWDLMIDLPLFCLFYVSCLTIWRVGRMATLYRVHRKNKPFLYLRFISYFLLTFIDPFFIAAISAVWIFSSSRKKNLQLIFSRSKKTGKNEGGPGLDELSILEVYGFGISEFIQFLFDIVFFLPLFVVLFLTMYRFRLVKARFWRLFFGHDKKSIVDSLEKLKKREEEEEEEREDEETGIDDESTGEEDEMEKMEDVLGIDEKLSRLSKIRINVKSEMDGRIVENDIRNQIENPKNILEMRRMLTHQFTRLLFDLPFLVPCVLYCFTLGFFRLPKLYRLLFHVRSDRIRREGFVEILQWILIDLICLLLSAVLLITIWRFPIFIYDVIWKKVEWREALYNNFVALGSDFTTILQIWLLIVQFNRFFSVSFIRIWNLLSRSFETWVIPRLGPKSDEEKKMLSEIEPELNGKYFICSDNNGRKKKHWVPDDVLFEIFMCLDGKSLAKEMQPVCYYWGTFIETHQVMWYRQKLMLQHGKGWEAHDRWNNSFGKAFPGDNNKMKYVKYYESTKSGSPRNRGLKKVPDHVRGLKSVVDEEFRSLFSLSELSSFFSLPFRVVGWIVYFWYDLLGRHLYHLLLLIPEPLHFSQSFIRWEGRDFQGIYAEVKRLRSVDVDIDVNGPSSSWTRGMYETIFVEFLAMNVSILGAELFHLLPQAIISLMQVVFLFIPTYWNWVLQTDANGVVLRGFKNLMFYYFASLTILTFVPLSVVSLVLLASPYLFDLRIPCFWMLQYVGSSLFSVLRAPYLALCSLSVFWKAALFPHVLAYGLYYLAAGLLKWIVSLLFSDSGLIYSVFFIFLVYACIVVEMNLFIKFLMKYIPMYRPIHYFTSFMEFVWNKIIIGVICRTIETLVYYFILMMKFVWNKIIIGVIYRILKALVHYFIRFLEFVWEKIIVGVIYRSLKTIVHYFISLLEFVWNKIVIGVILKVVERMYHYFVLLLDFSWNKIVKGVIYNSLVMIYNIIVKIVDVMWNEVFVGIILSFLYALVRYVISILDFTWNRIFIGVILVYLKTFVDYATSFLKAVWDLLVKVFHSTIGLVFRVYYNILFQGTIFAKKLGFVGEILLFPLTLSWFMWPYLFPILLGNTVLYIPATIASSFLVFRAYNIVKVAWTSDGKSKME